MSDEQRPYEARGQSNGTLDDKARLESCTKLAEIVAGRVDSRRQVEWRVQIVLWAGLAATIVSFRAEALPILGGVVPLVFYVIWLRAIYLRFNEDSAFIWHYINEAQRILARNDVITRESVAPYDKRRFAFGRTNLPLQLSFTVLLMALVYAVCADRVTWVEFQPKVIEASALPNKGAR